MNRQDHSDIIASQVEFAEPNMKAIDRCSPAMVVQADGHYTETVGALQGQL